jgi:hypothetical protein
VTNNQRQPERVASSGSTWPLSLCPACCFRWTSSCCPSTAILSTNQLFDSYNWWLRTRVGRSDHAGWTDSRWWWRSGNRVGNRRAGGSGAGRWVHREHERSHRRNIGGCNRRCLCGPRPINVGRPVWHRSVPMSSMQSPRTNGSDPYCLTGLGTPAARCVALHFARSSKNGMCCWRPIVLRRAVNRTVDIDAALVPYERQLVFSGISTLSGQPATAFPAGPSSAGLPVGASSNRA